MERLPLWTSIAALLVSVGLLVAVMHATIRPLVPVRSQIAGNQVPANVHSGATASSTGSVATSSSLSIAASSSAPALHKNRLAPKTQSKSLSETAQASSVGNFAVSSAQLRAALVNVMCYAPASSSLHSISGSGVIIDPKGVILTNAHVAQYFLLADRGVSCVIRSGSPATDQYNAKLEYLPPAWVAENAGILSEEMPTGTGEHDYALLAITGSASDESLPARFPSISLAALPPPEGSDVVIASYGAQFLNTVQIQTDLSPTVVFGSIKGVYTFATSSVDVLALGGSAAAQEGSSGGGVANGAGALVGLITTSTVTGSTAARSLNAITASYIRADYAEHSGESIDALLSLDPAEAAATFSPQIPTLEASVLGKSR